MNRTVIYSETLEQKVKIAWDEKDAFALCDDGVYYNPSELRLLSITPEIPLEKEIHLLKKVFNGELVEYQPKKTVLPVWYRNKGVSHERTDDQIKRN